MIYSLSPPDHRYWYPLVDENGKALKVTPKQMITVAHNGGAADAGNHHEIDVAYCYLDSDEDPPEWKRKSGTIHLGFQDSVTLRGSLDLQICAHDAGGYEQNSGTVVYGYAEDFVPNLTPFDARTDGGKSLGTD